MTRVVMLMVGMAAAIFIGQFIWSFKMAADDERATKDAEFQKLIHTKVADACKRKSIAEWPEACARTREFCSSQEGNNYPEICLEKDY